jgi:hypothetical protein
MKAVFALVLGLSVVSAAAGADEPAKNPMPKDFVGKWVGKWDDTWKVQFTVTQDPKTQELSVLYEWEETLGKPFESQRRAGKIEKGVLVLGSIEITPSGKDKDKADAVGKFAKTRTAALTRVKEAEKEKDKEKK